MSSREGREGRKSPADRSAVGKLGGGVGFFDDFLILRAEEGCCRR